MWQREKQFLQIFLPLKHMSWCPPTHTPMNKRMFKRTRDLHIYFLREHRPRMNKSYIKHAHSWLLEKQSKNKLQTKNTVRYPFVSERLPWKDKGSRYDCRLLQEWRQAPAIPVLGWLGLENYEFETGLRYTVRPPSNPPSNNDAKEVLAMIWRLCLVVGNINCCNLFLEDSIKLLKVLKIELPYVIQQSRCWMDGWPNAVKSICWSHNHIYIFTEV